MDAGRVMEAQFGRSSPRGEVTGNKLSVFFITGQAGILPSRGGDWKPHPGSRPSGWSPRSSPRGEVTGNTTPPIAVIRLP